MILLPLQRVLKKNPWTVLLGLPLMMLGTLTYSDGAFAAKPVAQSAPQNETKDDSSASQYCSTKLSIDDQNQLYQLTLQVLKEVFTEKNLPLALEKLQSFEKQHPRLIHVIGNHVKNRGGRLHISLCYDDHSKFRRCSDVWKEIKDPTTSLSEVYQNTMTQPLKPAGIERFGDYLVLMLHPKNLSYKGKEIASNLHISLVRIRENDDLLEVIQKKLMEKVKSLKPLELSRTACRTPRKQNRFVKGGEQKQSPMLKTTQGKS